MKSPTIEFVNHASVIISYDEISILSDPWYKGTIFNNGGRRGDFIRVIYMLWEPTDTLPSIIDSVFISGSTISYTNGIISDACLNPGDNGTYKISIYIPDTLDISHWTKDVKFDLYD